MKSDENSEAEKPATMVDLLNPTIRMLRFGYLYNNRTDSLIKMSDALKSRDLQMELNREEEHIITLKYRPTPE